MILSPATAIIVAADAARPSITTVTLPLYATSWLWMACAAKTSPPPLLMRTVTSLPPRLSRSSAKDRGVTSSPHQLLSPAIGPYSKISLFPLTSFLTCQNLLGIIRFTSPAVAAGIICPRYFKPFALPGAVFNSNLVNVVIVISTSKFRRLALASR